MVLLLLFVCIRICIIFVNTAHIERAGLQESLQPCSRAARKWRENEEMERKWGNGERLTLYISSFSLYFLPLSPFPPSLSISYIKMHHILLQNVKYGTFVANVTEISTYALWGNNSGSNLLRGSSAFRAGLWKGILGVENIGYPVLYCKAPLVFFSFELLVLYIAGI